MRRRQQLSKLPLAKHQILTCSKQRPADAARCAPCEHLAQVLKHRKALRPVQHKTECCLHNSTEQCKDMQRVGIVERLDWASSANPCCMSCAHSMYRYLANTCAGQLPLLAHRLGTVFHLCCICLVWVHGAHGCQAGVVGKLPFWQTGFCCYACKAQQE
jgi:hypothetical protein